MSDPDKNPENKPNNTDNDGEKGGNPAKRGPGRPPMTDEERKAKRQAEMEMMEHYAQSTDPQVVQNGAVDQRFVGRNARNGQFAKQNAQSETPGSEHNDKAGTAPGSADAKLDGIVPEHSAQKEGTGKRKNPTAGQLIGRSAHSEEYIRLMKAGWTSFALERYAAYRYNEKISSSTFRNYKSKRARRDPDWIKEMPLRGKGGNQISDPEMAVDVLGVRNQLAVLQMQRISVDVKTEMELGKLFNSTGKEIDLLSVLLDKVKADQQDYGILPKVADETMIRMNDIPADVAPKHMTLGAALGVDIKDPEQMSALARRVGSVVPINRNKEAG